MGRCNCWRASSWAMEVSSQKWYLLASYLTQYQYQYESSTYESRNFEFMTRPLAAREALATQGSQMMMPVSSGVSPKLWHDQYQDPARDKNLNQRKSKGLTPFLIALNLSPRWKLTTQSFVKSSRKRSHRCHPAHLCPPHPQRMIDESWATYASQSLNHCKKWFKATATPSR